MHDFIETDCLVIGCGIAGAISSLELAEAGLQVLVVTRGENLTDSATDLAQGGIVYRGDQDSPDILAQDIMRTGGSYCSPKAVEILVEEGAPLVRKILMEKVGVTFDADDQGKLTLIREGGHSVARIAHRQDQTGRHLVSHLVRALSKHPNVRLLPKHTAVDLLTPQHHSPNPLAQYEPTTCVGAYLFDQEKGGEVVGCLAPRTILATGGLGQLFLRNTNPAFARGDGLAMAYRAGARVINAEFIQFHPTTFFQRDAAAFLISEAVRGAGGKLVYRDGTPFMEKYDPEWKDLAPRDVVSRAIYQEMMQRDLPNVYLDLASHLPANEIRHRFPGIFAFCLRHGVDISQELIPVVPAAHYSCGGVWVDEVGETNLKGLYAVGEVACTGVHGANRLASTSLLEGLVWGYRAARSIIDRGGTSRMAWKIRPWKDMGRELPDPTLMNEDMNTIKHIMWNYVGLVRSAPRLQRALKELRNLEFSIEQFYRESHLTDQLIGLRNAIQAAIIVASAAWKNKTSVGCHYRIS
ncbi:MAG: L-aspartate oxidase [Deltaproteobacteria bacterium]|nr:L-aspartate oxidase [Deltaproteobacteria bacterium]